MTDMNKQTEALKLAEDALKRVRTQDMELVQLSMIALAALREALAEQPAQQEPVAEVRQDMTKACPFCAADSYHLCGHFTSPPAQEFVCSTGLCHYRKPLTDGQVIAIANMAQPGWVRKDSDLAYLQVARAIEAAHGITKENT